MCSDFATLRECICLELYTPGYPCKSDSISPLAWNLVSSNGIGTLREHNGCHKHGERLYVHKDILFSWFISRHNRAKNVGENSLIFADSSLGKKGERKKMQFELMFSSLTHEGNGMTFMHAPINIYFLQLGEEEGRGERKTLLCWNGGKQKSAEEGGLVPLALSKG